LKEGGRDVGYGGKFPEIFGAIPRAGPPSPTTNTPF